MYYIKLKMTDLQVFSFKAVFMFFLFQFVFIVCHLLNNLISLSFIHFAEFVSNFLFLDLYYTSKNNRQMKNTQVKKQQ